MSEEVTYDEDTLFKVYRTLDSLGYHESESNDIVNSLLNAGILFRERV